VSPCVHVCCGKILLAFQNMYSLDESLVPFVKQKKL